MSMQKQLARIEKFASTEDFEKLLRQEIREVAIALENASKGKAFKSVMVSSSMWAMMINGIASLMEEEQLKKEGVKI